jgi:gamma-glutamylcysteine synthetase
MTPTALRHHVDPLFRRGGARTTGVGIEQELFATALISGGSVHPDRVRSAIAGRPYARWVSFEPGGQVELSLPRAGSAAGAARQLQKVTGALAADLQPLGIVLEARPVRHVATPRYLRTARYDAMEHHFDTVGPAGRRMMRHTCSTQVCLDWWPGQEGIEQWRLLQLAAPFLAAATISDPARTATWLAVDPDRTAFDDRLLTGDDPVAAYVDYAAGAEVFVAGGVAEHLTTLFPPVRPRGRYLEVRFPDARPAVHVGALAEGLAGLLYEDERRRHALASLTGERTRLADHWAATAAGQGDVERGLALLTGSATTATEAA